MPRRKNERRRRNTQKQRRRLLHEKVKKDEKKAELKVRKVTRLYKPALSAGKAPKQAKWVTKK